MEVALRYTLGVQMSTVTLSRHLSCAFVLVGLNCAASAATIVVPGPQAFSEGNSNNSAPFTPGTNGSERVQQVYAASSFSGLGQGDLITQLLFRPDGPFGSAFTTTIPDIQINLSTTAKTPDGLSTVFAENVGADETVVYARGPLTLSTSFTGPVGRPKNFDLAVNLTTPFFYDPALGNLLMDVRTFRASINAPFDAQAVLGDPVSRVFEDAVFSTTGRTDSLGLVTAFTFVPEPGSLILLGSGMVGIGIVLHRAKAGADCAENSHAR